MGTSSEQPTTLCLSFGADAVTFAGCLNGSIHLWKETELQGEIEDAHEVFQRFHMETDHPWSAAASPTSSWHAAHG